MMTEEEEFICESQETQSQPLIHQEVHKSIPQGQQLEEKEKEKEKDEEKEKEIEEENSIDSFTLEELEREQISILRALESDGE